MARSASLLNSLRDRVRTQIQELEKTRATRDAEIHQAIQHGMTWRDAAAHAGISTVQVGKIMRKHDEEDGDAKVGTTH
jgi:predicted transcriptional regulator